MQKSQSSNLLLQNSPYGIKLLNPKPINLEKNHNNQILKPIDKTLLSESQNTKSTKNSEKQSEKSPFLNHKSSEQNFSLSAGANIKNENGNGAGNYGLGSGIKTKNPDILIKPESKAIKFMNKHTATQLKSNNSIYFHKVLSQTNIQDENTSNKLHSHSIDNKKNIEKLEIGIPSENQTTNYSHTLAISKQIQNFNIKTPQTNSIYFPELSLESRKSQSILKRRPLDLERKIKIKDLKIISDSNILKVEVKKELDNSIEKKNGDQINQLSLSKSSKQLLPSLDVKKLKKQIKKESHQSSETEQKSNVGPEIETPKKQQLKNIINISYATQKGQSALMNKINQDRLVIRKKLSGIDNLYLLAVADGHGVNGHLVSKHIKKILPSVLEFEDKRLAQQRFPDRQLTSIFTIAQEDRQVFQNLVRQLLSKVFNSVNKQIEVQKSFDIQMSGSTLVAAIVSPQFIITSNCGDSRCIVINFDGSIALSTLDHKPNRSDEKQRIEQQYRGRVKRQGELNPMYRGHNDISDQPYRVWAKELDLPGLAMSRSIGDQMAKTLGVIAEPEVQIYDYTPEQLPYAIALASDGIWDVIESNQFSERMQKIQQESQIEVSCRDFVNQLVKDAHQLWIDEGMPQTPKKQTPEVDDITLILGIFNKKGYQAQ